MTLEIGAPVTVVFVGASGRPVACAATVREVKKGWFGATPKTGAWWDIEIFWWDFDREGITWIHGHYTVFSPEVLALLAAHALAFP